MEPLKTYLVERPFLNTTCSLGEAPHYESKTNTLRFLDIENEEIHTVDLSEGPKSHKVLAKLDISIGKTADIEGSDDDIIFAGTHWFGTFNKKTTKYECLAKVTTDEEKAAGREDYMRFNDGAIDPQGRFWAGTMCDPRKHSIETEGVLFRFDADKSVHRMQTGLAIPNGMSWTDDGKTMYLTDTPTSKILAYDFDAATGSMTNERIFFHVVGNPDEVGGPDGHALDAEGHMWVALCGGSRVVRVSPEGKVVAEIKLPTRMVTCPAFAGKDLYITTAAEPEPKKHAESAKLAGRVYKCHVGVAGQPVRKFKFSG